MNNISINPRHFEFEQNFMTNRLQCDIIETLQIERI